MADKLPALHFYVQDYLADTRALTLSQKGFYLDLLCYMHKSSRRGYYQQTNGNPYSLEQTSAMTGCSTDEASQLLRFLIDSEVISVTNKGIPYSRRMVRDEKKRLLCKKAGHLGGNPTLKGQVNPPAYGSPEDEDKDLKSSDLRGDPRGGNLAHVRGTLASVDPGNLMPAAKEPDNIQATRSVIARVDPSAPSAKDEFWQPLCHIFGIIPRTIADEQRLYQQCVDFRLKGATVQEIETRSQIYRLRFSEAAFTPRAILNNWDIIDKAPPPKVSTYAPTHFKKSKALT